MSKTRRDLDYLRDIEDAIGRILDYTAGLTWVEYLQDYKTQDAVVHNLEVIGEATKSLSDEIRSQYPNIPWRDMTGTRDRLTHHYFGINQEIVWQIVEQNMPSLRNQIEHIVGVLSRGES
jgi:uncharacterized protein with HEPN domain